VKLAFTPILLQSQADARQHAKKRAVHPVAFGQVHKKLAAAVVDSFHRVAPQWLSVLKCAATDHAHKNRLLGATD